MYRAFCTVHYPDQQMHNIYINNTFYIISRPTPTYFYTSVSSSRSLILALYIYMYIYINNILYIVIKVKTP